MLLLSSIDYKASFKFIKGKLIVPSGFGLSEIFPGENAESATKILVFYGKDSPTFVQELIYYLLINYF